MRTGEKEGEGGRERKMGRMEGEKEREGGRERKERGRETKDGDKQRGKVLKEKIRGNWIGDG